MARRRKIPARKHHGVRDPLKQLELKEKSLKNSINNPPEIGNDQKISYKFAQFKKLADDVKCGKKIKKPHAGREDKPVEKPNKKNKTRIPENKVRNIKQISGESDEDYLRRVNRMTTESLREAKYEAKYGVNVLRDPQTGEITIKKRPKNEIDELLKQKQNERINNKRKGRKASKSQQVNRMDPKEAKALIKQAIKEDKEEKRNEKPDIEEYKRDVISFGEIVHRPPTLSTLPRRAEKVDTVPRPGKKNLLLKTLLDQTDDKPTNLNNATTKLKGIKNKTISKSQLKGKRKDLPLATRSMLENEQSKIVELYRQLKKSKQKNFE
ncbi:coiled-coil domain-containing protein 137-like [Teleopsis dalmanni]|uniref:coiled-coil domain-containing protein 137-like n=1 Tax=Teleopsis dalmanni TaxID=139649 RepID=UPI000D32A181|nr:coiled-coil domain-containing protein 137-like [Teleopsis dalmanni]